MGVYPARTMLSVSDEIQAPLIGLSYSGWTHDKPGLLAASSKSILEANINPLCAEQRSQLCYQQHISPIASSLLCQCPVFLAGMRDHTESKPSL